MPQMQVIHPSIIKFFTFSLFKAVHTLCFCVCVGVAVNVAVIIFNIFCSPNMVSFVFLSLNTIVLCVVGLFSFSFFLLSFKCRQLCVKFFKTLHYFVVVIAVVFGMISHLLCVFHTSLVYIHNSLSLSLAYLLFSFIFSFKLNNNTVLFLVHSLSLYFSLFFV